MGKFDIYRINLKGEQPDKQEREYLLDNQFFINIGQEDIQKGKVDVQVTITRVGETFVFSFELNGKISIPCDRCLDDMDLPIETSAKLVVKFGKDYEEESDEVIVIPENEGAINLAWFLYEFVVLAIPIKHVHAPGKCNRGMTSKLKQHIAVAIDDEEMQNDMDDIIITDDDTETDPRWDELKKLKDNNNNNN